jgi:hypothetical protein
LSGNFDGEAGDRHGRVRGLRRGGRSSGVGRGGALCRSGVLPGRGDAAILHQIGAGFHRRCSILRTHGRIGEGVGLGGRSALGSGLFQMAGCLIGTRLSAIALRSFQTKPGGLGFLLRSRGLRLNLRGLTRQSGRRHAVRS